LLSQVQRRSFPGHVGSNLVGTAVDILGCKIRDLKRE
jgi:hypothetical protein